MASNGVCWRPGCSKPTAAAPNRCPACRRAVYCGPSCRKAHRKLHKKECADMGQQQPDRIVLSKKLQARSGEGQWTFRPNDDGGGEELMQRWAGLATPKWMSRSPPGTSPRDTLRNFGIGPAFVDGLTVGDYDALSRRMIEAWRTVRVRNDPPLRAGDVVEVVPGNHVEWESVGKRGELLEYFPDEGKWGVDLNPDPSLIMEGNLKRVSK